MIQLRDGTKSVYDGKMKLPELVTWVMPHALSDKETFDLNIKLEGGKQSN